MSRILLLCLALVGCGMRTYEPADVRQMCAKIGMEVWRTRLSYHGEIVSFECKAKESK